MTTIRPHLALATGFCRQTGKDTLVALLHQFDPRFVRYSFADALRRELECFIAQYYGISVWTTDPEEKEFIRPYLITHGMARRTQDPDYWVKQTVTEVQRDVQRDPSIIPCIVDARFRNECDIVKRDLGAKLVYVTREGAPEPTEEEKRHYPALIPLADLHFHWGGDTEAEQAAHARRLMEWLAGNGPDRLAA